MSATLQALLDAVQQGPDQLRTAMDQRAGELTPAVGEESLALATQGAQAGKTGLAQAASFIAVSVFRRCGDNEGALRASLVYLQTHFFLAQEESEYQWAHDACLKSLDGAGDAATPALRFRAMVLAADCAYFASTAAKPPRRDAWLMVAGQELAVLESVEVPTAQDSGHARFVSLLASVVNELTSKYFGSEQRAEVETILRSLARVGEKLVPAGYVFPGSAEKTGIVARTLALLSWRHGDKKSADARSDAELSRAARDGDHDAVLSAVWTRRHEKGASPEDFALIRKAAEALRFRYRSRAGRLVAAEKAENILGQSLMQARETAHEELFYLMEGGKARTLLDQLQVVFEESENPRVAELEREILRHDPMFDEDTRLNLELQLTSRLPVGGRDEDRSRERALAELEGLLEAAGAGFDGVASPATLEQVRAALQPGELLVEFCIPSHPTHPAHEIVALAASRDEVWTARTVLADKGSSGFIGRVIVDEREPLDASQLGELVLKLRTGISALARDGGDGEMVRESLARLHSMLIEPLEAKGCDPTKFERLIIVSHGSLHAVPMGALIGADGQPLIAHVEIVNAPSASVWLASQKRARAGVTKALLLGNPTLAMPEMPALPQAEQELKKVSAALPGVEVESHVGGEATEAVLRERASGRQVIHLATHGLFPNRDALDLHQVLLAPSPGHDGKLHSEEVRRLDLGEARLAALSICDGGLHRFGPGDEPYGLIPAFLAAGAENVLAALWPVNDAVARQFMADYYRSLLKSGPAGALRATCCGFIEDGADFSQWASFALVGVGRRWG